MSKSLNFVVSIKLDRRSVDVNGNHPIKLRVWNRASKRVKMYSCNKFSDPGIFEKAMNHKATVKGDTFVLRTYLERVLSNATDVLEGNIVKSHEDFENKGNREFKDITREKIDISSLPINGNGVCYFYSIQSIDKDGDGDIDFVALCAGLDRTCPNASFVPEIWQGHKDNGAGFWFALDKLERWFENARAVRAASKVLP